MYNDKQPLSLFYSLKYTSNVNTDLECIRTPLLLHTLGTNHIIDSLIL